MGNMHHEDAVEFALDAAACSAATRTAVACTSPCAWCGALVSYTPGHHLNYLWNVPNVQHFSLK